MASTLQITDGTTTVNLLNSTGLYLKENGWKAAVAQEDENGDYQDMIEVITCTWMENNDDDRAETLKTLKRLDRKAREHWRRRKKSGWVWLEASTHSETDTRYAIIKSIDVKELDTRHWQANQPSEITLVIKHVLWWGIAPNGTPTTVVNNVRITNQDDATDNNYVTINDSDVKGDAPALTIIEIYPDTGVSPASPYHTLAIKSADSLTELNNVSMHLNAADEENIPKTADTDSPGGQRISRTGAEQDGMEWSVTNIEDYVGQYLFFAVAKASSATGFDINFLPASTSSISSGWIKVINTSDYQRIYLGSFRIPVYGDVPNEAYPTNYGFDLNFDIPAGVTMDFRNIYMVKVDEAVFDVQGTTNLSVANGVHEIAYEMGASVLNHNPVHTYGKYLQLPPNRFTRIYFFSTLGEVIAAKSETLITVKIVPRYTSLRGND